MNRNVSAASTATDFHRSLLPLRERRIRYEFSAPASVQSRTASSEVAEPDSSGATSVEVELAPCRLSAMTPAASISAKVSRGILMIGLQSLVQPSPIYRLGRNHFLTDLAQIECLSRANRGVRLSGALTERAFVSDGRAGLRQPGARQTGWTDWDPRFPRLSSYIPSSAASISSSSVTDRPAGSAETPIESESWNSCPGRAL